jgi:dipeptidyl aminopeptidase/acylaminoacyl peptidase
MILMMALISFAQDAELKVTAEDELAPIRAIKEKINNALAEPMSKPDMSLFMEANNFYGTQPGGITWDGDSSRFWFTWKEWDQEKAGKWVYDLDSGKKNRLSEDDADLLPGSRALWNADKTKALWNLRGDIVCYDSASKKTSILIQRLSGARLLGFDADETILLIQYRDNLLALALDGKQPLLARLTDIRKGTKKNNEPKSASQKWTKAQQLALFDVLNRRNKQAEERKERSEKFSLESVYLKGWGLGGISPSQTLEFATLSLRQDTPKNRVAEMPNYLTESGYTESRPVRSKVGDELDRQKMALVHLATGKSLEVDFGLGEREISFYGSNWSPDGSRYLINLRAVDNKDRWLAVVTPTINEEGELKADVNLIFTEHDDAWISWDVARGIDWMPDGQSLYFVSEYEGKLHLYTVPAAGGEVTALTKGDFIVDAPSLTGDKKYFVYSASMPGDPHTRNTFKLPVNGGEPVQITSGFGRSNASLSPDGKKMTTVASSASKPWELFISKNLDGTNGKQITESPSPAFNSYKWAEPELINFTASDGVEVPARLYRAKKEQASKPAVIFVHGAGYTQNVHNWWASYSREYCFHNLLIEEGFTVIDIDYRGSAGYGRDWRTAIYQHMGGKDLSDQVDGAKYMVEQLGVNPDNIGLYGGSYGGFISLMALFNEPDTFAAGAALRPVTDWAAYNHGYTSNILNNPQDDPDSYIRSSPIYFAEGLKGALLICHGVLDDNVHFQGVVRLAQRLIELRKANWEVAMYPIERHGFVEPASWFDEYSRIFKLFKENLRDK